MPRKSSIRRLPPPIRQELDRIISEDRFTLDEILAHLRELGADVSRSAVHRYKTAFDEAIEDIRLTREMAQAVGRELSDLADGDATPYIVESLQVLLLNSPLTKSPPPDSIGWVADGESGDGDGTAG